MFTPLNSNRQQKSTRNNTSPPTTRIVTPEVAIAKGRELGENAATTICCTRYGNVMASRGSVIPLWVEQMIEGKPITITDPNMTRFMMTLDDAVDLVVYAFTHGHNGDLFVQKAPATKLNMGWAYAGPALGMTLCCFRSFQNIFKHTREYQEKRKAAERKEVS